MTTEQQSQHHGQYAQDQRMTFADLVIGGIQAVWRRRWLIAVPIMVLVPLTIAAALLLPRTYASTALLLLQEDVGGNALEKSENRLRETRQRATALERLILSDRVLNNAMAGVYGEKLDNNPKVRAFQLKELREALRVSVEGGQFIEISLKDSKPEGLGRKLDSVLVSFFDSLLLPISDTRTAPSYMVEKKAAIVLEAEQQRDELIRSSSSLSLQAIGTKREEIKRLQTEILAANARLKVAKRNSDTAIETALGTNKLDSSIESMIRSLAEEIEKIQATQPGSSSELRDLQRKQRLLESALPLKLRTDQIEKTIATLTTQLETADETLNQSLTGREQIDQLDARIQGERAAYNQYRQRFNQARSGTKLVVLRAPERIKIVDQPEDPKYPLNSALKILLVGLGAALALGAGLAVTAEQLDESIRSARDAEVTTGIPVVASLAHVRTETVETADPPDQSETPEEPERLIKRA